jgi:hypothetical protein
MKKKLIIYLLGICLLQSCGNRDNCKSENCKKEEKNTSNKTTMNKNEITAKNTDQEVSCKLTNPELQKRKETVIASLKKQILEKKELENGFAYRFEGNDNVIDELVEFVKSERSCCSFFTFGLSFSGDGSEAWLNLTGPDGAKQMIVEEIGL